MLDSPYNIVLLSQIARVSDNIRLSFLGSLWDNVRVRLTLNSFSEHSWTYCLSYPTRVKDTHFILVTKKNTHFFRMIVLKGTRIRFHNVFCNEASSAYTIRCLQSETMLKLIRFPSCYFQLPIQGSIRYLARHVYSSKESCNFTRNLWTCFIQDMIKMQLEIWPLKLTCSLIWRAKCLQQSKLNADFISTVPIICRKML